MSDKPEYRVYRSRPGLLRRLLYRDQDRFAPPAKQPAAQPRTVAGRRPAEAPPRVPPGAPPGTRPGLPPPPGERRAIPWRRIGKWALAAVGGVKMKFDTCLVSRFEGKTHHIGCEGSFRRCKPKDGKTKLDGSDALAVVRIRKNRCAPEESDLTRARRQQKFLEAVKGRIFSPFAFPRWPWAAWRGPRALPPPPARP